MDEIGGSSNGWSNNECSKRSSMRLRWQRHSMRLGWRRSSKRRSSMHNSKRLSAARLSAAVLAAMLGVLRPVQTHTTTSAAARLSAAVLSTMLEICSVLAKLARNARNPCEYL